MDCCRREKHPIRREAIQEIYRITKDIPHSIVKLANECLIRAAVESSLKVDKGIVISAAAEIAIDVD